MDNTLHITSGDCAGALLVESGVPGEVFVWHDILYDGPRKPGWLDEDDLRARAYYLEQVTGGGLHYEYVLNTLQHQYQKIMHAGAYERVVLWFDACLFDQSMLVHVLTCLRTRNINNVELICVDEFSGVIPFDGLGQLTPDQLASLVCQSQPVTESQFAFAVVVDRAFANQDQQGLFDLSCVSDAPLPWVPAAVRRWIQEQPDGETGLGQLERITLEAIHAGCDTPATILAAVRAKDSHPIYWGDTMLWAKINGLAERTPPLVRIEGPQPKLPQWEGLADLTQFRVTGILCGDD